MKIFVSGIAGFLGSHLADALIKQGHTVSGCDSMIGGYFDNVPREAIYAEEDCNDLEQMRVLTCGCDIVYHCAATPYEGLSVFSPHLVTTNIVTATSAMVSAAISNKVRRFVFLSSMARYGAQPPPFVETMPTHPQDPYGIGKVAAEELLKNLADTHGMEWVIAVPHNIIGPRQKYDDPYRNVAAIFINRLLQGEQPILYGDGLQMRCFSFVSDVVAPLVKLGTEPTHARQIFNLGPDDEFITIKYLGWIIADLLQVKFEPMYTSGRPREVTYANCSADKARRLLGYRPRVGLTEGLVEMIDWIRKRGTLSFNYHLPLEIVNDKTPRTWVDKLI